jgi:hypothetical protein
MLNMYTTAWLAEWVSIFRHAKIASCFTSPQLTLARIWWNVSKSINRFVLPFIFIRPSGCIESFPLQQPVNRFSLFCKIWDSYSSSFFLKLYIGGYNAVQYVDSQLMFRRNMSPPSSGSKNKLSMKPARSRQQVPVLPASCFLRLSFDSEDGGDMFLRNVGWLSTDYKVLYPIRFYFRHDFEHRNGVWTCRCGINDFHPIKYFSFKPITYYLAKSSDACSFINDTFSSYLISQTTEYWNWRQIL